MMSWFNWSGECPVESNGRRRRSTRSARVLSRSVRHLHAFAVEVGVVRRHMPSVGAFTGGGLEATPTSAERGSRVISSAMLSKHLAETDPRSNGRHQPLPRSISRNSAQLSLQPRLRNSFELENSWYQAISRCRNVYGVTGGGSERTTSLRTRLEWAVAVRRATEAPQS